MLYKKPIGLVCIYLITLLVSSCGSEPKVEGVTAPALVPFKETIVTDSTSFANNFLIYDNKVGIIGVLDVPEMLVLSTLDSAARKDLPDRMVNSYALLEKEMNEVGAEMNGPIGMISYNNSPSNFVFESVLCIKKVPKIQPKKCKIVVLEASKMVIYNFYGPYQNLFAAYDKVERYCKKNDLIQSGPMREFYITDPARETNQEKWLTRIFLPVVSMRK